MLREATAGDPGDGFLHFDTEGAQGPQAAGAAETAGKGYE